MENRKIKINLNSIDNIKRFNQVVRQFRSDVDVVSDKIILDAKSFLGLYSLNLSRDIYVRIISDDVVENRNFEAAMEEFR